MKRLVYFNWLNKSIQKIDMSIAIVCMVNQTALDKSSLMNAAHFNETYPTDAVKCMAKHSSTSRHHDGPFVWSKSIQGFILSAYFYGYIFTQVGSFFLFKLFNFY
jgi:hypothetical protein